MERLKGKYIKYSPEITEEVFNNITRILTEIYGESLRRKESPGECLINLSTNYRTWIEYGGYIILRSEVSSWNWHPDNHDNSCKEISYQEFLKIVEFPEEGYCDSIDESFVNYLSKTRSPYSGDHGKPIGYAWNKEVYWKVDAGSNKKLYSFDELKRHFKEDFKGAVRGNIEYSKDTIKFLKSKEGKNSSNYRGDQLDLYYFIKDGITEEECNNILNKEKMKPRHVYQDLSLNGIPKSSTVVETTNIKEVKKKKLFKF